ncbi:hypothetical protein EsH8_V_000289 [Colletotrichum jinshuiense]
MPAKNAAAAVAPAPLGEVDANRISAPNPAAKPAAPKSRKRRSDADGDPAAPAPKKQAAAKKKDDPVPDLSGIHLDGDDDMTVPLFDTCDTVRTKIRAILKKDGVTKAAFLRRVYPQARPEPARQLHGKEGPRRRQHELRLLRRLRLLREAAREGQQAQGQEEAGDGDRVARRLQHWAAAERRCDGARDREGLHGPVRQDDHHRTKGYHPLLDAPRDSPRTCHLEHGLSFLCSFFNY